SHILAHTNRRRALRPASTPQTPLPFVPSPLKPYLSPRRTTAGFLHGFPARPAKSPQTCLKPVGICLMFLVNLRFHCLPLDSCLTSRCRASTANLANSRPRPQTNYYSSRCPRFSINPR